ncbi:MAG: LEPR-XLL domain-containing protein [Rhizobiales bacterium]|nr:LEPR-XLL domain-containing protein [Hyphomicrobiales bacterium]
MIPQARHLEDRLRLRRLVGLRRRRRTVARRRLGQHFAHRLAGERLRLFRRHRLTEQLEQRVLLAADLIRPQHAGRFVVAQGDGALALATRHFAAADLVRRQQGGRCAVLLVGAANGATRLLLLRLQVRVFGPGRGALHGRAATGAGRRQFAARRDHQRRALAVVDRGFVASQQLLKKLLLEGRLIVVLRHDAGARHRQEAAGRGRHHEAALDGSWLEGGWLEKGV